jgi:hypothetical protein
MQATLHLQLLSFDTALGVPAWQLQSHRLTSAMIQHLSIQEKVKTLPSLVGLERERLRGD